MKRNSPESFWALVTKSDGCWTWNGWRSRYGYGYFSLKNKHWRVHRLAMVLSGYEVQPEDVVMHKCDNTSCVRPDHLRIGTQIENRADCVAKKRHATGSRIKGGPKPEDRLVGSKSYHAKVAEEDVVLIRTLRTRGMSLSQLATLYPLHPMTIGEMCRRETWRHVP